MERAQIRLARAGIGHRPTAMPDPDDKAAPVRYGPRQERIALALSEVSDELAALYRSGLWILANEAMPARVYHLGHAIREIQNRLPNHLGIPGKPLVEYSTTLNAIQRPWEIQVRPLLVMAAVNPGPDDAVSVALPRDLAVRIDHLVREHESSATTRREMYKQMLASRDVPGRAGIPDKVVAAWMQMRPNRFVHVGEAPGATPSWADCQKLWSHLEDLLHALLAPQPAAMDEIDELLDEANS